MARHFEVEVKPFNVFLTVVVAKDITKGIKYAKKTFGKSASTLDEKEEYPTLGLYYPNEYNGMTYHAIFLREDVEFSTIVHECFHALMHIAEMRGAKWTYDSDEFYAYSLGGFTGDVLNNIYGSRLRKK